MLTENTGLARMVRGYVTPARWRTSPSGTSATSPTSVERMIGPDATVTLDFALARMTVMEKLLVYPATMQKNLDRLGGSIHSQRVLLALTQAGVSREDAPAGPAQRDAGLARRGRFPGAAQGGSEVAAAPAEQIEACFDLGYHFKHVDTIFGRVFGDR
ncbi:hypothetical protein ACU4GA_16665 [Methylobacterium oryzae CBMB20]